MNECAGRIVLEIGRIGNVCLETTWRSATSPLGMASTLNRCHSTSISPSLYHHRSRMINRSRAQRVSNLYRKLVNLMMEPAPILSQWFRLPRIRYDGWGGIVETMVQQYTLLFASGYTPRVKGGLAASIKFSLTYSEAVSTFWDGWLFAIIRDRCAVVGTPYCYAMSGACRHAKFPCRKPQAT